MNKRVDFNTLYKDISNNLITCDTEAQNYESNPINFLISFVNRNSDYDLTLSLYNPRVDVVESKTGRKTKIVCYDFLQKDISKSKKLENDLRNEEFELTDIVQSRINLGDFKDDLRHSEYVGENLYFLQDKHENEKNVELKHDLRRLMEVHSEFANQREKTVEMLKHEEKYLLKHASYFIQNSNCLVLSGHNFMTYDMDQMKTLSKNKNVFIFSPGIDDSAPLIRPLIKDTTSRAVIKGLPVLDTLGISRFYCPFPKNSLEFLIGALKKELGVKDIDEVKDIDYDKLSDNVELSELGNSEASFENARYCYNDTCLGDLVSRFFLEPALTASYAFNKDLSIVSSSSPYSLAVKLRDLNYFDELKTVRNKSITKDISNLRVFDFEKEKRYALRTGKLRISDSEVDALNKRKSVIKNCSASALKALDYFDKNCNDFMNFDIETGLFNDVHVFYIPIFPIAFKSSFSKDKHMSFIYDIQKRSDHPLKKYMAFSCLEAFVKELFYDLTLKKDNKSNKYNQPDIVFKQKYNINVDENIKREVLNHFRNEYYGIKEEHIISNINSFKLEYDLNRTIKRFANILHDKSVHVINFSNKFFFFKTDNDSVIKELYKDCIYFGKSNIFSIGRGRVKTDINDLSCGLNVFSKYKRCDFEIDTLSDFVDTALRHGRDDALIYLNSRCRQLVNLEIPRKDLLIKITCKKDPEFTSEEQQEREWQKIIEFFGLKEDESVKFGFVNSESRYEKSDRFRLGVSPIDLERYLANFFGPKSSLGREFSKGTIGEIAKVLISGKHSDRKALDNIVSGIGSENDLSDLGVLQKGLFSH